MPLNHPGLPHPLRDPLSHSFRKRKGHRNTHPDEARPFLSLFAWHLLRGFSLHRDGEKLCFIIPDTCLEWFNFDPDNLTRYIAGGKRM